jgi:hypothetical protein
MTQPTNQYNEDVRYRPQDECPLFSESLEEHIVGITRGTLPNHGTFCGNCYTPLSPETAQCPHCGALTEGPRPPVAAIPDDVIAMLREQRKTESSIVNAFAYAGFIIAIAVALWLILTVPYLRPDSGHLIIATIVFSLVLIIGGRTLAGVLGGYFGDHVAYDRARKRLRSRWAQWSAQR